MLRRGEERRGLNFKVRVRDRVVSIWGFVVEQWEGVECYMLLEVEVLGGGSDDVNVCICVS